MSHPDNKHSCTRTAIQTRRGKAAHGPTHSGHRFRQRLLASLIGGALVAGAVALPAPVWAQSVNARLRGHAPPNTQVTAFNVATGVTRHTRSGADGSYLLPGLPPGTYTVSAGPGTQRTITVSVASTLTVNFKKATQPQATANAVNATELKGVTSVAAAPDLKTSQVATTVTQHQIRTLPQVSRNFLEFADVVPGMNFTVSGNGETKLRAGAGRYGQANVYIDGVSQKDYVFNSAMAGQHSSQGNPFPQLAIGQYKVINAGYKAEYAQVTTSVITAVTKSGTNEFHGQVFMRYTNDNYRTVTPAEDAKGEKVPSHEKEYGFAFGGPIIKNKMHFFVTYSAKRFDTPTLVAPSDQAVPGVPYLPSSVRAQYGPTHLPFKEDLYFVKVDWEPTSNDRIALSARIRKEHTRAQVGGTNATSSGLDQQNTDRRYILKWDHSSGIGFNELTLTHQYTFFQPTPIEMGNGKAYDYLADEHAYRLIHIGPASPLAAQDKGQKGFIVKDDFTLSPIDWHGTHIIKLGVLYRHLTLKAADAEDINPQFSYGVTPDGVSAIPYKVFFTKPVTGLGLSPTVVTHDKQYGIYVQDDWAVNDKLTLNLGLRWAYEDNPAYLNYVTPANVVAALHSQYPGAKPGLTYAEALAAGGPGIGYDVSDYISTGDNRSSFKGEWQPRLGFSYDLFGNQDHVIHGFAGRSYGTNVYNYLQLETTKAALPQFTRYIRNPATGQCFRDQEPCIDWDPAYLNGLSNLQALVNASNGGEIDVMNNRIKPPHTDQFALGMRNRIGDWQTDATLVRKLYYGGFAFTLGNRYPDGAFFKNGSQPWGNPVPGFGSLILGSNGIQSRTTQVLFSAKKPFTVESGWGATIAYTYTDAVQNRDVTQHYSFDYAFVGKYPFITSNATPKHRLVATGSVNGPWGLVFGAKLTLATPRPWNGIACYDGYTFANGSHCQAVSATPGGNGRFLIGGDVWGFRDVDLQVTKNFHLPYGTTMFARFDILNVFNFKNYVSYHVDTTGGPGNLKVSYRKGNGAITYVPRTVKFEIGVRF
ncbi:MAG TPA: TonB-dependent receptor [Oleiagrimonas sp.]|nr:TonB-dependent receptor [Oleiagrimonas sp.]